MISGSGNIGMVGNKMKRIILICLAIFVLAVIPAGASYITWGSPNPVDYIKIYNDGGTYSSYVKVSNVQDIVVYKGSYMYAGTPTSLYIYDIRNAANPKYVKKMDISSYGLAIKNSYLYVGGTSLRVYLISSPTSPRFINSRSLPGTVNKEGLEIYNNVLYVSTTGGVKTFPI